MASSPFCGTGTSSKSRKRRGMYSTVRPLGTAPTRCTWISGTPWLTTGRLKASAMPWGDAAGAHLIDHHDVDGAGLDHVAERHNAPEVFAAGDRGREGR